MKFLDLMLWLHCKNHIFAIIDKKASPLLLCGSTHRCSPTSLFKVFSYICRGGSVCPPASEMILEFANMSSKLTFLQWNHGMIRYGYKYEMNGDEMKITLINGSLKKMHEIFDQKLAHYLQKMKQQAEIEQVDYYNLKEMDIRECIGCFS